MLADRSPDRNSAKDGLTRALLSEYQDSHHPLWTALLVLAYLPLIGRIASRIRTDIPASDEREQLVVTSFLEVIATIRPERNWICISLRRDVERRVFKDLHRERRMLRFVCPAEPEDLQRYEEQAVAGARLGGELWPETRRESSTAPLERYERDAATAYLTSRAGQLLDSEELALITATAIDGERIAAYVDRCHADLSDIDRYREYQRIKRRHSRAMVKLRHALAAEYERQRDARADRDVLPWAAA